MLLSIPPPLAQPLDSLSATRSATEQFHGDTIWLPWVFMTRPWHYHGVSWAVMILPWPMEGLS